MMRYSTFLREHLTWMGIFGWLIFSIETFLLTVAGASWLMIYTAVILVLAYFTCTYVEYWEQKKYITEIQMMSDELEKKYLMPEMIQPGKKQEERCMYEVLRSMQKSMNEQVSAQLRTSKEYKEYIEMWIHEVKVPIAAARMILVNHRDMDNGFSEQVDRLENYVEQALFYARSSDVEKDYLIKQVNLRTIVEQALLQRKTELLHKHASVSLHDCEVGVYSDGKWMEFMIGQVFDNSIKYAKEAGLTLTIYAEEAQEQTLLHIADNGIGVKAEEAERVFNKGFTGSNGRKFKKSTGIGLYLCRKLCNRLGHNMLFASKEGEGSMVTFIFPKSVFMDGVR
ncbi:MAG TPA: sensor histidine kinase [Lachnospiraceae bacterium]|nr:sensor histidine kinase [Lachnospiraceae bacterium]